MALRQVHGRYAAYWNAAHTSSGHAWQGRFYSCPLDEAHLWQALRYAELNPVRAKMVPEAVAWPWSSAGGALRNGRSRPLSRHQALEPAMVSGGLAEFSGRGGNGAGVGCRSPEHPHRAATGIGKVHRRARTGHRASAASTERRSSQKAGHQREAGRVYVPQTYPAIHPATFQEAEKLV